MKKQFFNFAIVVAMIGTIAASCSSAKQAGGSDSTTVKDTSKMSTPVATDTTKKDTTVKKDTLKTTNPPK